MVKFWLLQLPGEGTHSLPVPSTLQWHFGHPIIKSLFTLSIFLDSNLATLNAVSSNRCYIWGQHNNDPAPTYMIHISGRTMGALAPILRQLPF